MINAHQQAVNAALFQNEILVRRRTQYAKQALSFGEEQSLGGHGG